MLNSIRQYKNENISLAIPFEMFACDRFSMIFYRKPFNLVFIFVLKAFFAVGLRFCFENSLNQMETNAVGMRQVKSTNFVLESWCGHHLTFSLVYSLSNDQQCNVRLCWCTRTIGAYSARFDIRCRLYALALVEFDG